MKAFFALVLSILLLSPLALQADAEPIESTDILRHITSESLFFSLTEYHKFSGGGWKHITLNEEELRDSIELYLHKGVKSYHRQIKIYSLGEVAKNRVYSRDCDFVVDEYIDVDSLHGVIDAKLSVYDAYDGTRENTWLKCIVGGSPLRLCAIYKRNYAMPPGVWEPPVQDLDADSRGRGEGSYFFDYDTSGAIVHFRFFPCSGRLSNETHILYDSLGRVREYHYMTTSMYGDSESICSMDRRDGAILYSCTPKQHRNHELCFVEYDTARYITFSEYGSEKVFYSMNSFNHKGHELEDNSFTTHNKIVTQWSKNTTEYSYDSAGRIVHMVCHSRDSSIDSYYHNKETKLGVNDFIDYKLYQVTNDYKQNGDGSVEKIKHITSRGIYRNYEYSDTSCLNCPNQGIVHRNSRGQVDLKKDEEYLFQSIALRYHPQSDLVAEERVFTSKWEGNAPPRERTPIGTKEQCIERKQYDNKGLLIAARKYYEDLGWEYMVETRIHYNYKSKRN